MGLNELMRMVIFFMSLCLKHFWFFNFYPPDIRKPFLLNYDLQQFGKLHLCEHNGNIYFFISTWSLQNSEALNEYPYFHSSIVICINSIWIWSPCNGSQLETGYITKALTGILYLKETCIDSDMNRHFQGIKIDLWKIKTPWTYQPGALLAGFPVALPDKYRRILPVMCRNSRYLGYLENTRTHPKL